jgi:hypothetical protein
VRNVALALESAASATVEHSHVQDQPTRGVAGLARWHQEPQVISRQGSVSKNRFF